MSVCSLSFVLTILGGVGGHPCDQHSLEWPLYHHHSWVFRELSGHRLSAVSHCKYFLHQNSATSGVDTLRGPLVGGRWEQERRQDSVCPTAEYGRGQGDHEASRCVCLSGSRVPNSCCCYDCCCCCYFTITIVLRQGLAIQPWLIWNLRCRQGYCKTWGDPPASDSWVLESQVCAITRDSKLYLLCTSLLYE